MKPSDRLSQLAKSQARTLADNATTGASPLTDEEWMSLAKSVTAHPDPSQLEPGIFIPFLLTYLDEQADKMTIVSSCLRQLAEAEENDRKASILRDLADRIEA